MNSFTDIPFRAALIFSFVCLDSGTSKFTRFRFSTGLVSFSDSSSFSLFPDLLGRPALKLIYSFFRTVDDADYLVRQPPHFQRAL